MPDVSIIVPVYGLAEVTRQCLDQLLGSPPSGCDREIIVVDDASTDHTLAMLSAYGDVVRVIENHENQGFARACNAGAAAAQGRMLVFLNNDTIPMAGWLESLVTYADRHPEAAIIGAKLLYPDGTVQHAGMAFDADREPQHLYRGFPGDHPAVCRSRRFPMVTGACLMIGRAAFEAAGGFDTAFRNGYEDVDLCLRVGAFGREVHYCHESVLIHLESVSDGRTAADAPNHDLYSRRWKSKVRPDDVVYYQEDGLLRFEYRGRTPMSTTLSPELGVIDDEARRPSTDRILAIRAEQVGELLRETIALRVRSGREAGSA